MAEQKYDIHERIYNFVLQVFRFTRTIPKTFENQIILQQLLRSVTSVGANDQEADGALTKPDFIHCYTIVRKEAKESLYWIRLLMDVNDIKKDIGAKLIQEGNEIVKIVITIIFRTRNGKVK